MIPEVAWELVAGRVQSTWRPREINPHQVAYGATRSGKDTLWRWGVLPTKPNARALVFDVKQGGDRAWDGWGADMPLAEWQPGTAPMRTRLLVPHGEFGAQLARRALEALGVIGEHVVILPDAGRITETARRGGLGCDGIVTRLMGEGASIGVTVLAGVTSTAWAASGIKDQAGRVWVGHTVGAEARRAFGEAAGLPRELLGECARLAPHQWIYADHLDGAPLLARVRPPGPPVIEAAA